MNNSISPGNGFDIYYHLPKKSFWPVRKLQKHEESTSGEMHIKVGFGRQENIYNNAV